MHVHSLFCVWFVLTCVRGTCTCVEDFRAHLAKIKEEYGHEEFHKKFMAIAEEESDCGSAKSGGNLGVFEKGKISFNVLLLLEKIPHMYL